MGLEYPHTEAKRLSSEGYAKMTIMAKKVAGYKFFQVVDAQGNVLQVLCSKEEAQVWIEQNS